MSNNERKALSHAAVTVAGGDDPVLQKDCRVGYGTIRAGCKVSLLIGAAERNQEYFLKYGHERCLPRSIRQREPLPNPVQPVAEAVAWAVLDTKNGNYFCTAAGSREQAERERCEYVRLYGRTDRFIIEPLYRTAATRGGEEGK